MILNNLFIKNIIIYSVPYYIYELQYDPTKYFFLIYRCYFDV